MDATRRQTTGGIHCLLQKQRLSGCDRSLYPTGPAVAEHSFEAAGRPGTNFSQRESSTKNSQENRQAVIEQTKKQKHFNPKARLYMYLNID